MKLSVTTIKKTSPSSLSIIIPCAGAGIRMKGYGPKALIEIKNKTIIQRQLDIINSVYPNVDIIVVAGFEANRLMNTLSDRKIMKVENENYENTGIARSIGMGLRVARTDIVGIVYGDLVFNKWALPDTIKESTIVVDKLDGTMKEDEVGCTVIEDRLEWMSHGLKQKWAHMLFLTGKELFEFQKLAWNPEKRSLFGFELITDIMQREKGKFKAYTHPNIKVVDVDYKKDIEIAEKI